MCCLSTIHRVSWLLWATSHQCRHRSNKRRLVVPYDWMGLKRVVNIRRWDGWHVDDTSPDRCLVRRTRNRRRRFSESIHFTYCNTYTVAKRSYTPQIATIALPTVNIPFPITIISLFFDCLLSVCLSSVHTFVCRVTPDATGLRKDFQASHQTHAKMT